MPKKPDKSDKTPAGANNDNAAQPAARAAGAGTGIISRNITTEMRESFLDYAMSVITDRAFLMCATA
jgi:hypothetical protein